MAENDDQRERLVATVERLTSDDLSREAMPPRLRLPILFSNLGTTHAA